jgi:hypothetical protein
MNSTKIFASHTFYKELGSNMYKELKYSIAKKQPDLKTDK